jgi:DNA polymerase III gamma/tau subunit
MKDFHQVVGQGVIVAALLARNEAGKHPPLLLWGPPGSGKLSLARLYAQSVICQSAIRPCGSCANCKGVIAEGSLRYIEMNARVHHSHENVRDQLTKLRSVGRERLVLVVRNAECLPGPVSDRLLKPLEQTKLHVVVFLSSDMMKVSAAIKSRCQVYDMTRSSMDEVVAHLKALCMAGGVTYEDRALDILARASDGWIGRAHFLLEAAIGRGAVDVDEALSASGFGRGRRIAQCWLAALRGDVGAAREYSLQIGEDCSERSDAMQTLLRAFYCRYVRDTVQPDVAHSLAVEDVDEGTWNTVRLEWEQLATTLNRPLLDCVRDMMQFWGRMQGLESWNLIFGKFCHLLHGSCDERRPAAPATLEISSA